MKGTTMKYPLNGLKSRLIAVLVGLTLCLGASASAQNALPLINQPLSPSSAVPGGAAFTLTVNGTGFASTAAVLWNGTARATTFVSSSKLTASSW